MVTTGVSEKRSVELKCGSKRAEQKSAEQKKLLEDPWTLDGRKPQTLVQKGHSGELEDPIKPLCKPKFLNYYNSLKRYFEKKVNFTIL